MQQHRYIHAHKKTHANNMWRPNSHTTGPGPRAFCTRDSRKRYVTPERTHNRAGTPRVLHKRLTQTVRDARTHTQQGRDPEGSAAARLTAGHHRTATRRLLVSPRLPPASVATFSLGRHAPAFTSQLRWWLRPSLRSFAQHPTDGYFLPRIMILTLASKCL